MNSFQEYFVEEFVQSYKDGLMSRRDMMRRVLYITGGIASTASLLSLMGCGSGAAPASSAAAPSSAPPSSAAPKPSTAASAPASAAAKPAASVAASAPAKPAASAAASASAKPAASGSAAAKPSAGSRSPLSVAANDPAIAGKDVSFPGNGTTLIVYEARPANASGALPIVLVCEQNRGLDEHIRDVTRRFAKQGYLAVALDMLSRDGGTAKQTDPAKIPSMLSEPTHVANQVGDWKAVADYYAKQPGVKDAMGMNGYCYGGSVTYKVATELPTLKAIVPYYGSTPGVDAAKNIKAAIFGVYSADPNDGANKGRDELDAALKAANITHTFKVYPGTMHAFNDDTGGSYNQEQALAAWQDMQDWFAKYLKA